MISRAGFRLVSVLLLFLATTRVRGEVAPEPRPFGDFGFAPPLEDKYTGGLFRLSQAYPQAMPDSDQIPKFLKIDFKKSWRDYLIQARDYCFEKNITEGDVEDDFDVARNDSSRWFHMPWQHYGDKGRECVHGLTKEAKIKPMQLAVTQSSRGQTYAVAFYNEFGGYEIGQVWRNPRKPELHDIAFPPGTVVFKLLFADIPLGEVGFLNPPLLWQGYITETYESQKRVMKTLALVQMDIMVRDPQSPLGWVFGTYQYNGGQNHQNRWENLVPLGLQWGNDPEITDDFLNERPDKTIRNPKLTETIINPDDNELPPTHLGWNGRLNGPVDNPRSSCMSCHATAQVLERSALGPMFLSQQPKPGSSEWMRWFQNYKCGSRFDEEVPSTDFSLQLAISIQNYLKWRGEGVGIRTKNYEARVEQSGAPSNLKYSEVIIQNGVPQEAAQILRDVPDEQVEH